MNSTASNKGLTIIELLIAMVLLGVLMTAILTPLTGLFQMTGQSTQTLNATTQGQEIVEYIQGQWRSYPPAQNPSDPNAQALQRSQNRYAQTCVDNYPSVRDGLDVTVTVWALDSDANEDGTLTFRETCGSAGAANPPAMKRVNVSVTTSDPNSAASLTVDIPRP